MHEKTENSVLVVAFDGLDKELIEDFELENIPQKDFGLIDNDTGTHRRKTSELFTCFVTGETHREHGVRKLKKLDDPFLKKSESLIQKMPGSIKFKGLREAIYSSVLHTEKRAYNRTDYDINTMFDHIENSKALNIPGYNPSPYWSKLGTGGQFGEHDVEKNSRWKYWDEHEYSRRRHELFRPVNQWFDLCMMHFHRVDVHQHFYGNDIHFDRKRLKKLYRETDELAKDIIEYFEDSYDTIIFMSDHGLPEGDQHNKNAFYSCNHELFGDKKPHITDFKAKILSLAMTVEGAKKRLRKS